MRPILARTVFNFVSLYSYVCTIMLYEPRWQNILLDDAGFICNCMSDTIIFEMHCTALSRGKSLIKYLLKLKALH